MEAPQVLESGVLVISLRHLEHLKLFSCLVVSTRTSYKVIPTCHSSYHCRAADVLFGCCVYREILLERFW